MFRFRYSFVHHSYASFVKCNSLTFYVCCCSNSKLKPISHLNKSNDVAVCLFIFHFSIRVLRDVHKTIFLYGFVVVILFYVSYLIFYLFVSQQKCITSALFTNTHKNILSYLQTKNRRKKDAFLHIIDSRNKQQITIPFTVWTLFCCGVPQQHNKEKQIYARYRIMTEIWVCTCRKEAIKTKCWTKKVEKTKKQLHTKLFSIVMFFRT